MLHSSPLRAVLALLLAFVTWGVVSFSQNPNEVASFDRRPITVDGLQAGYVLVDDAGQPLPSLSANVDVTVGAPREVLSSITQVDIRPYIDLTALGSGTHNVTIGVRTPDRVTIREVDPQQVAVRIERVLTATVPLRAQVSGQPPFSYRAREPQLSFSGAPISQVVVEGPESQVQRVTSALVGIDIGGQTSRVEEQAEVRPLDDAGSIVLGVEVRPATVSVAVDIESSVGVRRVPVLTRWTGIPADGYALVRITPIPDFVVLVGNSRLLNTINVVESEPIDITGASASFTQTVDLPVPPGVSLLNQDNAQVQVAAVIEPVDLRFSLSPPVPVVPANLAPSLQASISPQIITIQLSGNTQALQSLSPNDLELLVDVGGLGAGTYLLTPTISLPSGISLDSELPRVAVELQPIAPTPAPIVPTPPLTTPTPPTTPAPGQPTPTTPPPSPSIPQSTPTTEPEETTETPSP